ncbi:hypothetical protein Pgy4_16109, partial [Pseudomonas savastanoi pv. glycinea str. race 4]
ADSKEWADSVAHRVLLTNRINRRLLSLAMMSTHRSSKTCLRMTRKVDGGHAFGAENAPLMASQKAHVILLSLRSIFAIAAAIKLSSEQSILGYYDKSRGKV